MTVIRIPRSNWTQALAEAIRTAKEGDTIMVHSQDMRELAERAMQRMNRKDVKLEIEEEEMSDKSRRAPINTADLARKDPSMRGWVLGGNPDAILAQEAGGQKLLVNSDTLPAESEDKAVLKAAGVKFGKQVEGDPLFQYVTLPPGWKKVPTDHSMWSNLVDEKGRKRAAIFYKAAFYDRNANWSANQRYSYQIDYDRRDKEGVAVANVLDGDKVIYTTEPIKIEGDTSRYEASDQAGKLAEKWLKEHFPKWRDAKAYWD